MKFFLRIISFLILGLNITISGMNHELRQRKTGSKKSSAGKTPSQVTYIGKQVSKHSGNNLVLSQSPLSLNQNNPKNDNKQKQKTTTTNNQTTDDSSCCADAAVGGAVTGGAVCCAALVYQCCKNGGE